VILVTGPTSLQVLAHSRQAAVGVLTGELQVDVLVEELKALLARHLRPDGPSTRLSSS
jgi:hypothetical protein